MYDFILLKSSKKFYNYLSSRSLDDVNWYSFQQNLSLLFELLLMIPIYVLLILK